MNAWKVIVSTLVIFIAGVITGGLLVTYAFRFGITPANQQPAVAANTNPNPGNPAAANNPWLIRNRELVKRMDRELDLTPEQHKHIEQIIAGSQDRIKLIYRPIAPLMNKEWQQTRSEIVKELTPEQRKKFEGLTKHPGFEKRRNATNAMPFNQTTTNPVPAGTNAAP